MPVRSKTTREAAYLHQKNFCKKKREVSVKSSRGALVRMASFMLARPVFCRGVGLCFSFAFASLYVQWEGLFGVDGVAPLKRRSPLLAQHSALGLDLDVWVDIVLIVGFCCSVPNTNKGTTKMRDLC